MMPVARIVFAPRWCGDSFQAIRIGSIISNFPRGRHGRNVVRGMTPGINSRQVIGYDRDERQVQKQEFAQGRHRPFVSSHKASISKNGDHGSPRCARSPLECARCYCVCDGSCFVRFPRRNT